KGFRRTGRHHLKEDVTDSLHHLVGILIYKKLVADDCSLFLLLLHQTIEWFLDVLVHQFPRQNPSSHFAEVRRDASLKIGKRSIRGEELVDPVVIVCERTASVEAKAIVCVADNGNDLHLHAHLFHFADETLDLCLLDPFDLAEFRSYRTLNETD